MSALLHALKGVASAHPWSISEIMINALIDGLTLTVRKPQLILIAVIFSVLSSIALYLNIETVVYFFMSLAYGIVPSGSLAASPFAFIAMYFNEILVLGALLIFIILMNLMAFAAYSAFVNEHVKKKKASLGNALKESASKLLPLLSFVFILSILGLILFGIWFFGYLMSTADLWIIAALLVLIALLLIYLTLKLLFVVPALFNVEPTKTRKGKVSAKQSALSLAIAESWNFSKENLLTVFVLLIFLLMVNTFVSSLIGSFAYGMQDTIIQFTSITVLNAILTNFTYVTLASFYYRK